MSDSPQARTAGSAARGAGSLGSYTDTEWDITTGVGFTALAVAAGRAMETTRPDALIRDPQAAGFVEAARAAAPGTRIPLPTSWPPDTAELAAPAGVDAEQLQQVWSGMATYMGVRSRFFDQYFHAACTDAGIRQVVLLAAGLDTRAQRLDWPPGTRLFEIDHPNVLAFKDRVLAEQGASPRCARHPVGVDLREDWPAALTGAGFDPTVPTAWLAEGLLFYLPDEAKQVLCRRVQELSAPESRWAIESISDPAGAMTMMRDNAVLQRMAAQFGADPTGLWPDEQCWEPHDWLVRQGWAVTAVSAHTVAARYRRDLDGLDPMANREHPSMLLVAAYEHPQAGNDGAHESRGR
jgi:methyltransferase (TIGR00027 family)